MKKLFSYTIACLSIVILIAGCLVSCTKQNLNPDEGKPVVESYLQPGQPASVKLSRQIPVNESDTGSYAITDAVVKIYYQGVAYNLQHTTDGIYTNSQIAILIDSIYKLSVLYNGFEVTASTTIPSKPHNIIQSATYITTPVFGSGVPPTMPQPITVTWDNPNSEYYFLVTHPTDTTTAIGNFPGGGGGGFAGFGGTVDQGNQRSINSNSFRYYGKHYMLLYHVQSDYAAFYNTTGSSSLNLTNIPTTIVNGFGIFTGVTPSDSLFVQVN